MENSYPENSLIGNSSFRDSLFRYLSEFRKLIADGTPYVWMLKLTEKDFSELEKCVTDAVVKTDNPSSLITPANSLTLLMYLAEWYKRKYDGQKSTQPLIELRSEDRKKLWDLSGINTQTFVYDASQNPDKPNLRWQDSLHVLGGLAAKYELTRDNDGAFLKKLCRIYHGEDLDLSDAIDQERAEAFKQSISCRHSLYHFLRAILTDRKPYADSDLEDYQSPFSQLIRRIESIDRQVSKNKFEFEWLISYNGNRKYMNRSLRLRFRPESVENGCPQIISAARLRDEWHIEHPEDFPRLLFDLEFCFGNRVVKPATFRPALMIFQRKGNKEGDFVLSGDPVDHIVYNDVPVEPFTSVRLMMRTGNETVPVQEPFLCGEGCLQVYRMAGTTNMWSSRKRRTNDTALIFSNRYMLEDEENERYLTTMPFRAKGEDNYGQPMHWFPIMDEVTIQDGSGRPKTFFNRQGQYKAMTKQYLDTIKYEDNLFVTYRYVDLDEIEDDDCEIEDWRYNPDKLQLLFGRQGVEVRFYPKAGSKEYEPIESYDLEWMQPNGRYVDWNEKEPEQGKLHLRITVDRCTVLKYEVYYIPFNPIMPEEQPIWRDFEEQVIKFGIAGMEDYHDSASSITEDTGATHRFTIKHTANAKRQEVLVDVYRPLLLKEIYQNGNVVRIASQGERIKIPMLLCDQFSIRDFNKEGVLKYDLKEMKSGWWQFNNIPGSPNKDIFRQEKAAAELNPSLTVNELYGYLCLDSDTKKLFESDAYEWDYKTEPTRLKNATPSITEGVVFQSLKDNPHPQQYYPPKEIENADDWDDWDEEAPETQMGPMECFKTMMEHGVYFFIAKPIRIAVENSRVIEEIAIPLMMEKNARLNKKTIEALYRLSLEFNFDWMLLPRAQWEDAIRKSTDGNPDLASRMRECVTDFFSKTPKATDDAERKCLEEMLRIYWDFNHPYTSDPIAAKALRLIEGEPVDDVMGRKGSWKEFLYEYDECRFKFSELSRVCIGKDE